MADSVPSPDISSRLGKSFTTSSARNSDPGEKRPRNAVISGITHPCPHLPSSAGALALQDRPRAAVCWPARLLLIAPLQERRCALCQCPTLETHISPTFKTQGGNGEVFKTLGRVKTFASLKGHVQSSWEAASHSVPSWMESNAHLFVGAQNRRQFSLRLPECQRPTQRGPAPKQLTL